MSNTDSRVFHDITINYDFVISKLEEGQTRTASLLIVCLNVGTKKMQINKIVFLLTTLFFA